MSDDASPIRNVTGRRLLVAFGAVLALFGAALAVELVTLGRIADAEADVARLDAAKHAGHMAAAQVREQYIHQAHTLIEFGPGHLEHYARVANVTRSSIEHLESLAETADDRALAARIATLAAENDNDFQTDVVPAILRGDRSTVAALGEKLESVVDRVVALNTELNAGLEARSVAARTRADRLRDQAVVATIACFALAILLAAAVGWWLTRTIVHRVDALRRGVRRVGAGDLAVRIELDGNDEFAELAAMFNQMAASLARDQAALVRSQKLASIGQVAAGVAHELNNPLGVVLLYAHLLAEQCQKDSRVFSDAKMITEQADRCKKIVGGLLNFARKNKPFFRQTDISRLVETYFKTAPANAAVKVSFVKGGGDLSAEMDPDQIIQVLSNLVTNAMEAMPSGGQLTVKTFLERENVCFSVIDTGCGIKPENTKNIFQPFFTTKQIGKGTGLGLAVSYGIIKVHRGNITVESNSGAAAGPTGTTFTVKLPRLAKDAGAIKMKPGEPAK